MDLIDKLKGSRFFHAEKKSISIVIFQDGIYLAKSDGNQQVEEHHYIAINHPQDWLEGITHLCNKVELKDSNAKIIIGSHLYQSYQIDTPNIPKEELSEALPFLIKDLITDKVIDIIADGTEVNQGKLQVYVSKTHYIKALIELLNSFSIELNSITPDELVWRSAKPEHNEFMLFSYSKSSEFKLLAFSKDKLHLNRSLRNISYPITGNENQTLQLDNLALELQRSLDYLSSQVNSININHLYFCCDDEDDSVLKDELLLRLGIQVNPLIVDDSRSLYSGEILSWLGLFYEPKVNLYSSRFKPKVDYLTFKNTLISWGILCVLVGFISGAHHWNFSSLEQERAVANDSESYYKAQLNELNKRLERHKPSVEIQVEVERLKEQIESQKASLELMNNFDRKMLVGYSGVIGSLTQLGKGDISLNHIFISGDDINLSGDARSAAIVPKWIQSFKREQNLVGRTFSQLKIVTNENGVVSFHLNSKALEGD